LSQTIGQYNSIIAQCKDIYLKKIKDYGTSWRLLRPSSLTDQIFIKAQRIRTIDQKGIQKVADSIENEFMGIVNYGIITLMQLSLTDSDPEDLPQDMAEKLFEEKAVEVRRLMVDKNHDYGEAWRDMRISSFTDLILTKVKRIRQIEDNEGQTVISEGVEANIHDIINYAIFALIKILEHHEEANR